MRRLLLLAVLSAALVAVPSGTAAAHVSSMTIDPSAQPSPGQQLVTVSGSVTCTDGESIGITSRLIQGSTEGQGFSPGMTGPQLICTGASQAWSVQFSSPSGTLWHPGRASAGVSLCSSSFEGGFFHSGCRELGRFVRIVR